MAENGASSAQRFLGIETSQACDWGNIIVQDGFGGEIIIPPSGQRAFPVQLDQEGVLYWRSSQQDRAESMPLTQSTRLPWKETNFLQVSRDKGQDVTWACYERMSGSRTLAGSPVSEAARNGTPVAASTPQQRVARPGPDRSSPGQYAAQSNNSLSQIIGVASSMTQDFLEYVEEAPKRLSLFCFLGGLGLILNSIFELLDIFEIFDDTIYYVVHAYLVFFGLVTCITELHADVTPDLYQTLLPVQKSMHEWAKGLTTLWGRGAFHLFCGLLSTLSSGSLHLGVVVGVYMMAMGCAYLYLHFRPPKPSATNDYVQVV